MSISLEKLIREAKRASELSYSPYSNFRVGSAVEFEDMPGCVFSGTNIENASYGLTICAERSAIFAAASHGGRKLKRIVIYAPSPTVSTGPCGACRQVIKEFADESTLIIGACNSDETLTFTMEELLPKAFGPNNLLKRK
jgi:cytidine deaminase